GLAAAYKIRRDRLHGGRSSAPASSACSRASCVWMSSIRLGRLPKANTSSDVRPRKCGYSLSSSNSGGDDAVNPAQQRLLRWRLPQSSTRTDVIGPCPTGTLSVGLLQLLQGFWR